MFFLLGEINFWTYDNDVNIKETDFGAFSYHDKKTENIYEDGKKSYAQRRGMIYVPQNKKGNRLKDSVKYLTEQFKDHSTIYCKWFDYCTIQIMLSSGLLIYLQVDLCSADIEKIVFDKYLVGKLSDRLSDVCTNNDSQVNLVNFSRPKKNIFEKISRLDSKINTFDLYGPSGRKLEKTIQNNRSEDIILIWWKSTSNEVYPWSPNMKEHNRANVHLYRIIGFRLELICYLRTEFDPLCIIFSTHYDNVIHSLEQKVSQKGEVTVEWRSYEVSQNDKLQRIAVESISLPTHTSSVQFSPNQEKLLICCIDGSLTLYDQIKGTNYNIKLAFIPTLISWHNDGNILSVGNERGQMQHFDAALTCIKNQFLNDDIVPNNIIDLSTYFRTQSALTKLEWNKKSDLNSFVDHYNHNDALFLMMFERGPIAVIKVIEGNNFSGDILVQKYLEYSQTPQAVSLLLAMNWDSNPRVCMHSLNQIVNYIFKLPLTPERENLIQNALGSFHIPIKPLTQSVIDEFGDEVRDLTRRFFHHLLRYRLFEKAFRLAIDLNDHDLFMDIHFYAIVLKDTEMAKAAKEKAEEIISRCNSCSSFHSTCSRSSCSICSDSVSEKDESYSDDTESEESLRHKHKVNAKNSSRHKYSKNSKSKVPPLPVIYDPIIKNGRIIAAPFTHSLHKTEANLLSTSYNLQNRSISSNSPNPIQNLNPSTFSTTMTSAWLPNFDPSIQNFATKSSDKLVTSLKNITLTDQVNIPNSSLEKKSNSYKILDHSASAFSGNSFNSEPKEVITNLLPSSLDNSGNTFMSTSFTNHSSHKDFTSQNHSYVENKIGKGDDKITGLKNLNPSCSTNIMNDYSKSAPENDVVITVEATSTRNNFPIHPILDCDNDLMSTSFNNPDDFSDNTQSNSCDKTKPQILKYKHSKINISGPSSMTENTNNLISDTTKNYNSDNALGLSINDNSNSKIHHMKALHSTPSLLHQQNIASNILQSYSQNSNVQSACKYKLDYDLDYLPLHNNSENFNISQSNQHFVKSNNHNIPQKFHSKPSKVELSSNIKSTNPIRENKLPSNVPPLPIISNNPTANEKLLPATSTDVGTNITEKPKVKFSDTVTHILVPNTTQSYRPIQKRAPIHSMDPKRELAESLPLYIGNEDYLKDFQPLSKESNQLSKQPLKTDETAKIKVVHFGLL